LAKNPKRLATLVQARIIYSAWEKFPAGQLQTDRMERRLAVFFGYGFSGWPRIQIRARPQPGQGIALLLSLGMNPS